VAQSVVEEIRAAGGETVASAHDVPDSSNADELIRLAIDTFGGLDILVDNAGILRDRTLAGMSDDDWDTIVRVHLRGTFAPSRAAAYWRDKAKSTGAGVDGRIISTSSPVAAVRQLRPDQLHRGQGRHRVVRPRRGHGVGALRRDRQRHRPGGRHPADRRPHAP